MRMLPQEEEEVREAIVKALGHHQPGLLAPVKRDLATGGTKRIRWTVIEIAERTGDEALLSQLASSDPDAYVRGLANLALD